MSTKILLVFALCTGVIVAASAAGCSDEACHTEGDCEAAHASATSGTPGSGGSVGEGGSGGDGDGGEGGSGGDGGTGGT